MTKLEFETLVEVFSTDRQIAKAYRVVFDDTGGYFIRYQHRALGKDLSLPKYEVEP